MLIHIYHQHFRYPEEGGAVRSFHLAKKLISEGHEVLVVTAGKNKGKTEISGIPILSFPIRYDNSFSFYRRIWSFLAFLFAALRHACFCPKPSLNYIISSPLSTAIVGLVAKKIRSAPFLFEIGDLWPEVPIQMGIIKNPIIKRVTYWLESLALQQASHVIALSPGIADYVSYKTDGTTSCDVIPNFSNCQFFTPDVVERQYTREDPFVISYIGTIGFANHLEYLIRFAAEAEKKALPVQFYIMGDGKEKPEIKKQAAGIESIRFKDFGNHHQVKSLLNRSQAIFLTFLNIPILHTGSPNKFFDGLAAGKLVITNLQGWIAQVCQQYECGYYYPPEDPEVGVNTLSTFIQNPVMLQAYQTNARQLAENQFELEMQLEKWSKLVSQPLAGL